ncbi:MAG TPA: ATP-grasp domain-containing protein [Polyangia bacterium]|jgi:D-alanine-D-alanine ligase
MKKARVLVLFDTDDAPPANQDFSKHIESVDEAEFDVARALIARGHEVRCLGFRDDIDQLVAGLRAQPCDVVFNLSERFRGESALDYTVVAILDMLGLPFTGATTEGLMLARDKALTKKVLAYHGILIPHFMVCALGQPIQRPSDLRFPLIVKPLDEDASVGIAQSSVVRDDEALNNRILFIHEKIGTDAIVEEFIDGRELYVGVIGNERPKALPPIEMVFKNEPNVEGRIATFKAKWSVKYRESRGIENMVATDLSKSLIQRLSDVAVRTYKAAGLRDYGRIDVRLAHDEAIYVVEANPNPYLADGEDLAWAAEEAGYPYQDLIEKLAEMALGRGRKTS